MKLLGSTKDKITKDENGKYVFHLEITKVVLVHWLVHLKILYFWKPLIQNFYLINSILFAGEGGAKMIYPSGFLKYLQNYLLNWLETFKVWFSKCLKAVLKKLLKIGVREALNHALSWMTSYWKKLPKFLCCCFFQWFFTLCHFHVIFASKNHLFWK